MGHRFADYSTLSCSPLKPTEGLNGPPERSSNLLWPGTRQQAPLRPRAQGLLGGPATVDGDHGASDVLGSL
jgi:hypothetical protein